MTVHALCLAAFPAAHSPANSGSLEAMAGKSVELRGTIGSGKMADYVLYEGKAIYFLGPNKTDTGSIPIGTRVIARGILQHNITPKLAPGKWAIQSPPEEYYSIVSAQVSVEP